MGRASAIRVWLVSATWFAVAAALALVLFLRLQLSFDLSAFFPRTADLTTEVLLEQLSAGPGSRMMVVGISGGDESERIETGRRMRQALSGEPAFSNVFNGEVDLDGLSVPEPIRSYYPLMADINYSPQALRQALISRLVDLSFGGGRPLRELVVRDPYFVTFDLLRRLVPGGSDGSPWLAEDGSAVIAAQTRAPGTDLTAQAKALEVIQNSFDRFRTQPDLVMDVTGVGAFSLELQSTIRAETQLLGILAGSAVVLVLLLVYRSVRMVLLAIIPLGLGYLAGLTLVTLVFDTVHGITLAFGFTLLGVAVDYPLHLYSHSRSEGSQAAIRSIWPTLRLGAASTATAYLAMVLSGSQGLSQLGLFTAAGVMVAVLATRTWLPLLLKDQAGDHRPQRNSPNPVSMRSLPAAVIIAAGAVAVAIFAKGGFWNDDLATLSPVPQERLETDMALREATGTSNLRHQLIVQASDLDSLLEESERVDALLKSAGERGLIGSWSSITALLPGKATQSARMASIPPPDVVSANLQSALAQTAFLESAFTPFQDVLRAIPGNFPLTAEKFENTPLQSWMEAHLARIEDQWVSLVTLSDPNAEVLKPMAATWGSNVHWVDMQTATGEIMRNFRHDAALAVLLATTIIVVLLLFQGIRLRRLAWVGMTVTAALIVTVCVVFLAHGFLTLVHLVALLLVLGLGLDYALFFSRQESSTGRRATVESVLACAASTGLAFGILSTSSIPLLRFIGLTVAVGSVANLALAWLGSRPLAPRPS